jgi:hypothetical protein
MQLAVDNIVNRFTTSENATIGEKNIRFCSRRNSTTADTTIELYAEHCCRNMTYKAATGQKNGFLLNKQSPATGSRSAWICY